MARIQACDAPIFVPLLCPAQNVDQAIHKDMAAYLGANRHLAKDSSSAYTTGLRRGCRHLLNPHYSPRIGSVLEIVA